METYIKSEISITAKQLAGIAASVQDEVLEALCDVYEGEDLELQCLFGQALGKALGCIGITLEFEDCGREEVSANTIVISAKESVALVKLQGEIWRRRITEGRSVSAVVDEMVAATINALGIKKVSGAAVRERRTVRKLRAA